MSVPGSPSDRHEERSTQSTADVRAGPGSAGGESAAGARAGAMIGHYRLLELLGEGGFGEVWLAEQTEPVRRRVALKLIKPGMDSRAVIARFEAERQALALMNHPGVAKVLDAGTTERGLPFFVMEHVAGLPITAHCDKHKLGIEERLELFSLVCDAVQHAHQKGVIHRDIKPSNVLVEYVGEKATPKVIDFGVAKALHQRLTERTVFTEQGQFIGTPEYMSPEQAEMTAQDIDTRSDIYSLGVLLYELLTGVLPFDSRSLRSAGYAAIQKIIREVEPSRPSTRLGSLGTRAPGAEHDTTIEQVAVRLSTDPRTLVRRLRGDLDWIVMKCLEKDRGRRYDSAGALARELERYLRHEPVTAGPPSATYKLSKFVRRNRAGVLAAAAIVLLILTGSGISVWQAIRATRAERLAESRRETAENAQRQEAELRKLADDRLVETAAAKAALEAEVAVTLAVNRFINEELFGSVDPDVAQGRQVTVKEVLDTAAAKIDAVSDQPRVESELRQTIGTIYRKLGERDAAKLHLQRALDLRERLHGPSSPPVAETLDALAWTTGYRATTNDSKAAVSMMERALAIRETTLGLDNPLTIRARGDVAMFRAMAAGRISAGLDPLTLGMIARARGQGETPEQVRALIESELSIIERLWAQGQKESAIDRGLRLTEPILKNRLLGDRVCLANVGFATLLHEQERWHAAEAIGSIALRIGEQRFGRKHADTIAAINILALVRQELGDSATARALLLEIRATAEEVLGPRHNVTSTVRQNLAAIHAKSGEHEAAVEIYKRVIADLARDGQDVDPVAMFAMQNAGFSLAALRRYSEAEDYLVRAVRLLGENSHASQGHRFAIENLALLYMDTGRPDKASELLDLHMEIGEQTSVLPSHFWHWHALLRGRCEFLQGRLDEAVASLSKSHSGFLASGGPKGQRAREAAAFLAHIARQRGDHAAAEDHRQKAAMTWEEIDAIVAPK